MVSTFQGFGRLPAEINFEATQIGALPTKRSVSDLATIRRVALRVINADKHAGYPPVIAQFKAKV
jgi:hypothetical protein